MSEWKECFVSDIANVNVDTYSAADGWSFINYLDTGNVTQNLIGTIIQLDIGTDKIPSRARRKAHVGNIIYSTVRPNQRHYAILKEEPENFLVSTGFAVLNVIEAYADARFLYFYLTQDGVVDHLQAVAEQSVSTYPSLNPSDIMNLRLRLPPLPTQRKIAAVLGALDDKIENNRKICANLEAQAQAIFKSWFVDFEPFGGKMPQGWKMGKLGDVIEVCYGKDHKALPEGNIPVFGSGGYMRSVDRCIYDEESVLIPRKGTLNNIMYVNEPFWTVDTMFYSKMREEHVAKYVQLLLQCKNMDEFNVGSAVPSMTTEILNNMEIIIPLTKTLQEFDGIASSFYAEVAHANQQSRSLAAMRDALLPKLMSGEIDVEKVEVA